MQLYGIDALPDMLDAFAERTTDASLIKGKRIVLADALQNGAIWCDLLMVHKPPAPFIWRRLHERRNLTPMAPAQKRASDNCQLDDPNCWPTQHHVLTPIQTGRGITNDADPPGIANVKTA